MSDSFIHQFQQINEILKGAGSVLMTSHTNPDPDAVGSILALHHALKKRGFNTFPYLPDPLPKYLNFLPGFFEIKNEISTVHTQYSVHTQPDLNFDVIFCLDYGDFARLKLPDHILESRLYPPYIITIDHHLESDQRGQVKIIKPEFSSTSEIIYHWFSHQNIEIDRDIATCLLTGIVSDSGGFCHVSTSPETLKIISQLLLKGAPFQKICRRALSFSRPQTITKIWGRALSRIKNDKKTGLAYSWISIQDLKECKAQPADLAGISSVISTISQATFALFLIEYEPGKIKGSLRSEPYKGKNVANFAKVFGGGGGHPYAAGFKQEGTIEEVLKKVLNLIG